MFVIDNLLLLISQQRNQLLEASIMNFIKLAPKKNQSKKFRKFPPNSGCIHLAKYFLWKQEKIYFQAGNSITAFLFLYFRHLETSLSSCQKLSAFFSN